jgi:hypothetical protein
MKPPAGKQAASEIVAALAAVLGESLKTTRLRRPSASKGHDLSISAAGHQFVVEYKNSASAGPLRSSIARLKPSSDSRADGRIPLVVVPYMGPVGRELCDRSGVAWLDLSGNTSIVAPGLRIRIEGRPNKYRERGRPPNVFAAKSSRVARQLLLEPRRFQSQAELARQTGLGDGYVSRIVRRLQQQDYVDRNDAGAIRPRDPDLLLDAWREAYDFNRHCILMGHVPARSGDELLHNLAERFSAEGLSCAATGLSAAWLLTSHAAFRLVTLYVPSLPSASFLHELEFSDEGRGGNLWLVIPDDEGVLQGAQPSAGVMCVSPIQAYLDLTDQPERSKDAAAELRRRLLRWGNT